MAFQGIGKKRSAKQRVDLGISDPGSDDSWAALYKADSITSRGPAEQKSDQKTPSKGTAEKNSDQKTPANGAAQKKSDQRTSAKVGAEKKSDQKMPAKPALSKITPTVATSPTTEEKNNDTKREELRPTNVSIQKTEKMLAFTSTPFVKHKKVPVFEVSSIISPIDNLPEGQIPHEEASSLADSTVSLKVNRKNPVRPPDETFNQLLYPGNKITEQPDVIPGIRPLKPVMNQADTTRQYAGGIVRGRSNCVQNVSKSNADDSWETNEEFTCTSGSKKTSSSPSKATRSSQKQSCSDKLSNDNLNSEPNSSNGQTVSNDENRMKPVVGILKSYQRNRKRIKEVESVLSQSTHEGQKTKTGVTVTKPRRSVTFLVDCIKAMDSDIGTVENKIGRQSKIPVSMINVKSKVKNTIVMDNEARNVPQSKDSSCIGEMPCMPAQHHNDTPEVQCRSIANEENVEERRVSSPAKDAELKKSLAAIIEITPKEKGTSLRSDRKSDEGKSCGIVEDVLTSTGKTQGENQCNFSSAKQDSAGSGQQILDHMTTESSVKMLSQRSDFAVQIGNFCLTQTSCIGFVLNSRPSKPSDNHGSEEPDIVVPVVEDVSPDNIVSNETSSNVKAAAAAAENPIESQAKGAKPRDGEDEEESSSEEERKLLRAQSVKLRKNQSNTSRLLKSSKITDLGTLGIANITQRNPNTSFILDASQTKSPVKSFEENRAPDKIGPVTNQPMPSSRVNTDVGKSSQQLRPNQSGGEVELFHLNEGGELESSQDLIFLSRNPQDCGSFSEDNLELQIMSSSEEENSGKQIKQDHKKKVKRGVKNNNDQKNSKHHSNFRNVSLKAKEIRRRREKKINEMLKSRRASSESDSQPNKSNNAVKQAFRMDTNAEADDGTPTQKSQSRVPRTARKFSTRANLMVQDPDKQQSSNKETHGRECTTVSPGPSRSDNHCQQSENSGSKPDELIRGQNLSPPPSVSPVSPHEVEDPLISAKRDLESQSLGVKEKPRNKKTHVQLSKRGPSKQKSQIKELTREHSKTKSHPEEDGGSETLAVHRYSKRKRQAPTMYWLGQRPHYKILENGCLEVADASLVSASVQPSPDVQGTSNLNSLGKGNKRKLVKEKTKVKKFKKSTKSKQATPDAGSESNSEEERVLICKGENILAGNSERSLSCKMYEVQERNCVRGFGVKGDLLVLGGRSTFERNMSAHFNQVYYVLEGEISYKFEEKENTLSAGSFFIIPKGEVCLLTNNSSTMVKMVVASCEV